MRQLLIHVPQDCGKDVLALAHQHQGRNSALFEAIAESSGQTIAVILTHLPNRNVEGFLGDLEGIPELKITLSPQGVMALQPPEEQVAEQVTNVEERSPIEVFLSGLQSVGSWRGFIGYAVAAGVVVWIGLFTNTVYLLVAAMLIAPFAGPAMNVAIATARGDRNLLKRGLIRYFSALLVAIAVSALLSFVLQQEVITEQMSQTGSISSVTALLPIVAGAAGALNLVQSERSSLVSGAATGMLIAASLAPPAGLVGMAGIMGRWDLAINGIFVLLLQLVGINLSATLVFRLFGISARGARYKRGKRWLYPAVLAATIVALIGLLSWQFSQPPNLQRLTIAQRANATIQDVVDQSGVALLVEADIRFTRPNITDQNTLLGTIYVQQSADASISSEQIRNQLTEAIQTRLLQQNFNIMPLIDVSVLQAPD